MRGRSDRAMKSLAFPCLRLGQGRLGLSVIEMSFFFFSFDGAWIRLCAGCNCVLQLPLARCKDSRLTRSLFCSPSPLLQYLGTPWSRTHSAVPSASSFTQLLRTLRKLEAGWATPARHLAGWGARGARAALFQDGSVGVAEMIGVLEHVNCCVVTLVVSCGTLTATPHRLLRTFLRVRQNSLVSRPGSHTKLEWPAFH